MQEHERIARYFAPLASAPGAAGLLDDVAELDSSGGRRVVTTDTLVENVHFLPCDPIDTVARKLVRVNVSDILAKGAHPREALLVVEVSDTSIDFDRGRKRRLYASHGIAEYWILDLGAGRLEIHRFPGGETYRETTLLGARDERVPNSSASAVRVADLLP